MPLIARFMGAIWWAPCWPHEPWYLGLYSYHSITFLNIYYLTLQKPQNIQVIISIEADEKWLSFCRSHFQIHFFIRKPSYFEQNITEFVPMDAIDNKPALIQIMALITDAYASLSLNELTWQDQNTLNCQIMFIACWIIINCCLFVACLWQIVNLSW